MPQKSTLAEFVGKAKTTHGDHYDYSQVVYAGDRGIIKIVCPQHGEFEQQAGSHLRGIGCPKCGRAFANEKMRTSLAEFIARARAVHGDHYDYSQVVYAGGTRKVVISCLEHGCFEQQAGSHLRGIGCPKCGRAFANEKMRTSLAEFIAKACAVHGDHYDYSQVVYAGSGSKVVIICPKHGAFEQTPVVHTSHGCGCQKCGYALVASARFSSKNKFVKESCAVHGDHYDYSQVVYAGSGSKVVIICPKHGAFEQTPSSHKQGIGCPKCGQVAAGSKTRSTLSGFIAKARAVHGDHYDYSQVVYAGNKVPVTITCPKHGDFMQKPNSHISAASGCPHCAKERAKASWTQQAAGRVCSLYFLRIFNKGESFYKIGITCLSIKQRYRESRSLPGYQYEVLVMHKSLNATAIYEWEQSILETFVHLRYRPKARFDGATECFSSCEEILSIFPL